MPQATFVHEGRSIDYTPAADVAAGAVVVLNGLVGVAKLDIKANTLGALAVEGVFNVVKAQESLAVGDKVYWNPTGDPYGGQAGSGAATKSPNGNTLLGRAIKAAATTDATVAVLVTRDAAFIEPVVLIPVEDLGAGVDIANRPVFVHPSGVELVSVGILTQGAGAGIDNGNTCVITVADDAGNTIVAKTYDTANQPPSSDFADLGALNATHKLLAAGEHVLLSVTQGTTANMPPFVLVLVYRLTKP